MLLFETGDSANFGKFAMRHCRIKTGVPRSSCVADEPAIMEAAHESGSAPSKA
jgi:hypothetical protein